MTRFLAEYVMGHAHRRIHLKPSNLYSLSSLHSAFLLPPWLQEEHRASGQEAGMWVPALLPARYVILVRPLDPGWSCILFNVPGLLHLPKDNL